MYKVDINEDGSYFHYETADKHEMLMKLEQCAAALFHNGYDMNLDGKFIDALVFELGLYKSAYQGLTFEQIIMQIIL